MNSYFLGVGGEFDSSKRVGGRDGGPGALQVNGDRMTTQQVN